MRIMLIHGRAQGGKDVDELKSIWVSTLKEGFQAAGKLFPGSVVVDFPFYGDKLDQFTAQANLPTPTEVAAKGPGEDREFEQFMQSVLGEMKERADISDAQIEAQMDDGAPREKGIQNWGWVQAIARVLDRHLTEASDFTIETFMKDVYLYVTKPAVTQGINQIVEEKLTDEPTVVVGHSLGSVVGYKVIAGSLSRLDLRGYITVGCPLGITAISSKLGLLKNPAGREGWYNAYDKRDIVALNPLDDRFFPTDPNILNNDAVDNKTDNRHGITGYLNNPNVARRIAECLQR